jgi:hypothetical protein
MEKRTPHCKLVVVKNLLAAGKVRATVSALAGGAALTTRDFYKSMTTPIIAFGRTSTGRRRRPAMSI